MGLFSFFLYTFTINYATTGARKNVYWVYFLLFCSDQCIKIISSRKKCGLFTSVFKKITPNNSKPTFQEVGGVI